MYRVTSMTSLVTAICLLGTVALAQPKQDPKAGDAPQSRKASRYGVAMEMLEVFEDRTQLSTISLTKGSLVAHAGETPARYEFVKIDGENVMRLIFNGGYAVYEGRLPTPRHIKGTARSLTGRTWKWEAWRAGERPAGFRIPQPGQKSVDESNSPVFAGTKWRVWLQSEARNRLIRERSYVFFLNVDGTVLSPSFNADVRWVSPDGESLRFVIGDEGPVYTARFPDADTIEGTAQSRSARSTWKWKAVRIKPADMSNDS